MADNKPDYKLLHRLRREYKDMSRDDILLTQHSLMQHREQLRTEVTSLRDQLKTLRELRARDTAHMTDLENQLNKNFITGVELRGERDIALGKLDGAHREINKLEHQRDILIDALDRLE